MRMTQLGFGVVCLGALLSGSLDAARWVIPGAAHAAGANNANFRTDLTIANPTSASASVTVNFLPADTDNAALASAVTLTVPAHGQLVEGDLVSALFGRSGGGALLVDSPTAGLVVTSRTYNQLPDKTYGMLIPGVPGSEALAAGETGHLVFLAKSDAYRTNVAFAGSTASAGKVTIRLLDGAGAVLGQGERDLPPYGQTQINDVFGALGAASTTVARAEVTGTVPFVAFASVIDNETGDPFAVVAQRASAGATELLLTAAAHAAGANNAQFRSDVRLFNTTGDAASVTLSFYPAGVSTTSPETRTLTMNGHQLTALDDILLTTFGKTSASGGLRISSTKPLLVLSRTYNDAPEGTSGQDLPAVAIASLIGPNDVARIPAFPGSAYRTNVIVFNTGAESIEVNLAFVVSGSASSSTTLTVPGSSFHQANSVFTGVATSGSSVYLEARTTSGGKYWIVATVIDNASNDPFQVAPTVERAPSSGGDCAEVSFVRVGLKTTHSIQSPGGNGTLVTTYTAVSATSATSDSVQTLPGASSTSTTTQTYHFVDTPLRGFVVADRIVTRASAAGFTLESTLQYASPGKVRGPGTTWCAGTKWTSPATAYTLTSSVGPTVNGVSPVEEGEIVSVSESVTVPAGTFQALHQRVTAGTSVTDAWYVKDGYVVKQVAKDGNGTTTLELTSVE